MGDEMCASMGIRMDRVIKSPGSRASLFLELANKERVSLRPFARMLPCLDHCSHDGFKKEKMTFHSVRWDDGDDDRRA